MGADSNIIGVQIGGLMFASDMFGVWSMKVQAMGCKDNLMMNVVVEDF